MSWKIAKNFAVTDDGTTPMKVFFIYPNAEGYQRIPIGVSILITILIEKGHEIELFDTTFIRSQNFDNEIREKANLVIPTDMSDLYNTMSDEKIDASLLVKLEHFSPDLIAVSIVEDNYQYADHLLSIVKAARPKIPVIAGGSTPTVAPEVVIENPNIYYIIQGEGMRVFRNSAIPWVEATRSNPFAISGTKATVKYIIIL